MYVYIYIYTPLSLYIYTHQDNTKSAIPQLGDMIMDGLAISLSLSLYIYIYNVYTHSKQYIHICIEREICIISISILVY